MCEIWQIMPKCIMFIQETGHVSAFSSTKLSMEDISCQNALFEHFVCCTVFCTFEYVIFFANSLLIGPFKGLRSSHNS